MASCSASEAGGYCLPHRLAYRVEKQRDMNRVVEQFQELFRRSIGKELKQSVESLLAQSRPCLCRKTSCCKAFPTGTRRLTPVDYYHASYRRYE